jgi:hypothetical protein
MDVANMIEVVSKVSNDIAVHDLNVVHVVNDFDAGRIHALADIDTPREVVEDLIGTVVCATLEFVISIESVTPFARRSPSDD